MYWMNECENPRRVKFWKPWKWTVAIFREILRELFNYYILQFFKEFCRLTLELRWSLPIEPNWMLRRILTNWVLRKLRVRCANSSDVKELINTLRKTFGCFLNSLDKKTTDQGVNWKKTQYTHRLASGTSVRKQTRSLTSTTTSNFILLANWRF